MNTTAQVKQAIKKTQQQIQNEPLELLKAARQQVSGDELDWKENDTQGASSGPSAPQNENQSTDGEQKLKVQVAEQDGRRLQALEAELRDIRRLKIYNELMRKVQNGEDIPVEEFQELSSEQREVLKAQMEAVKNMRAQQQSTQPGLIVPASKPGRQMGSSQKKSAQQQTTRVEKPVPPSG